MHTCSLRTFRIIPAVKKRNEVAKVFPTDPARTTAPGSGRLLLPALFSLLVCLATATNLRADTISGTVKDPSGAVVVGAHIEITGSSLAHALVLTSDESGKYAVRVTREGFEELVAPVDLHGTADLALKLTIAEQQVSINVNEKSLAFANSDPFYQ